MDAILESDVRTASRPLGEQERMLHYVHNVGGLLASHILHIRGPLDLGLLRRAFDWLQRRHGMLGAHIESRGLGVNSHFPFLYRKFWWITEGTEPIPINEVQGDWREILQKDIATRFPAGNNPRLRVTVVPEGSDLHHVIVTADHAIGDAQAALMGARELMGFLADPDGAPLGNDSHLPPAMESGHTPSSNPTRPYEAAIRLPTRIMWKNKPQTLFEKRLLTVEQTSALNAAVKAKRTTLHGAVVAAVLQSAGRHFGVDKLTALSNVEFRKLMKPQVPNETYGCYIDIIRTTHELNRPFWKVAGDIAFKLVTAIAKHQHQVSGLKQPERDWYRHEFWPTVTSDSGMDAFAITTGGESRLEKQYGPLTLEDMDVVISLNPLGPAIYVLAIETQGQLSIGFCYASRRVSGADAIAILDGAVATLGTLPAD